MRRLLIGLIALLISSASYAEVTVLKATTMDKKMNIIVKALEDGSYICRGYTKDDFSNWARITAINRKYVDSAPVVELSVGGVYLIWIIHFPEGYKALSYLWNEVTREYDVLLLRIDYLHIEWFKEVMSY